MIELVALILGLVSWVLLLYCIFRHKHLDRLKIFKFQALSWALCSVGLYIPSLSQKLQLLSNDYDGIIDCINGFHVASLSLLAVTLVLSVISLCLSKKSK